MRDNFIAVLDLHGESISNATILVTDFLLEQYLLGKTKIKIIHGIGTGLLRREVFSLLAKNEIVKSFKLDMYNLGITIVHLKD